MPGPRGRAPTRRAKSASLNAFWIVRGHDAGQQREGAVVQFHDHAVQGGQGRGHFQELQDHGLLGPSMSPAAMRKMSW